MGEHAWESTEYLGEWMREHEVPGWVSTEYLDGIARSTWMGEHGVPGWVSTE
jgi:hypothetical protein